MRILRSARILIASIPLLAATAVAQQGDRTTEFLNGWKAAEEVGDVAQQEKLLQRFKQESLTLFMQRVEARALHPEDEALNVFVDRYIEVWTKVTNSGFARIYDRYVQRLGDDARTVRDRYVNQELPVVNRMHIAAIQKTEDVDLRVLRERCDLLVANLENLGDLYYVAFARNIQGNLWNPRVFEEGADGTKALEAYARALDARRQLELTSDQEFSGMERMWKELKFALGIVEEGEEEEAKAALSHPEDMKPADGVTWTAAPLTFGSEKKPGAIVHANDLADDAHHAWLRVVLPKVGEQREIPGLASSVHIFIEHTSADRVRLIAGGEPGKEVRLGGKPTEAEVEMVQPDGSKRPYRLLLAGGTSSDMIQGVQMNLAPTEDGGFVFFRSLATYSATTPFGELTVYDANCDGWFGYAEMIYDWTDGLLPDTWFYSPDAYTLGAMKHSQPFSRFIRDEAGQWYEVKLDNVENPKQAEIQPVGATLGKLRVNLNGLKKLQLASFLLASESSPTKGLVIDLAAWKGPEYEVPIGRYIFRQARFVDGKGGEMIVLPHPTLPMSVDVGTAETATFEIGEPFTLAATAALDGTTLTVNGRALHVVGKAGERYVRFWGAPLFGTEAAVKGAKGTELRMPTAEEAGTDWERLFYPMDAVIELKKAEKTVVELLLKKHPWFGKLSGTIAL